jgi:predicted neuraminidase
MTRASAIRVVLIVLALPSLIHGLSVRHPRFAMAPRAVGTDPRPFFASEFLPAVATGIVHGATMAELPNGDLVAAWYGGTNEAMRDVVIFVSVCDHRTGRWSEPRVIESRASAQLALGRVKSVGNPVLLADGRGLRLFFVAVVAGGWSGGTICQKSSPDGISWSEARHIVASPVFNVGMLVRGAPAAYDDGTCELPVYHQLGRKWSAMARVDAEGHVIDESRIETDLPLIQPWIVVDDANHAQALLRFAERRPSRVLLISTRDAGRHWSDIRGTPLVHRDSGVSGVRLDDGSLIVFYNETSWSNPAWNRRNLSMVRSADGGVHWSTPYSLEHDPAQDAGTIHEYSYPCVLRTHDGRLHVLYTWHRKLIRHLTFNAAWVQADPTLAVMR